MINLNFLAVSLRRKDVEDLPNDYSVLYVPSMFGQNLVLIKLFVNSITGFLEINIMKYSLIYH